MRELASKNQSRHEMPLYDAGHSSPERQAWIVLFASVLAGAFLVSLPMWMVFLNPGRINWLPLTFILGFHLITLLGYPAIARYRIKECPRFRRVVFSAGASGSFISFYLAFEQMKNALTEEISKNTILLFGILFCICLLGYGLTRSMARRTQYLFSNTTNDWLHSFVTKAHIADPSGELTRDPRSVNEVLQYMQATRKRFSIYTPTLFLDTVPEGEHWLCLEKTDFHVFGLNITRRTMFFRADWNQVEEIRAHFGEFRKTFFISTLSRKNRDM